MDHPAWSPIRREEFDALLAEQEAELEPGQRALLDACRVDPWQAIIQRSSIAGDEKVWVIAERNGQVLYFDDVEWGWNSSEVDEEGRLLRPGGGQGELKDVLGSREADS